MRLSSGLQIVYTLLASVFLSLAFALPPALAQAFSNGSELGIFYATTRDNEGTAARPSYGSGRHLDLGQGSLEYGVAPLNRGNFNSIVESKNWQQLRSEMAKRDTYWTNAKVGQASKLSDTDFFNRVKNFHGLICIYVHGYDITFEESARELAELADEYEKRSGQPVFPILFSWPSTGSKVDYSGDEASLEWSAVPFRDFVNRLNNEKSSDSSIDLLAHSMGSRLAFWYAMAAAPTISSSGRQPFRNIFLSCADIDYYTGEQRKDELQKCAEKNVFILTNDNDGPLLTSQALHAQTRLGRPADGGIAIRQIVNQPGGARLPRNVNDLRNMATSAKSGELLNQVGNLLAGSQPSVNSGNNNNSLAQFALTTFLNKPSSSSASGGLLAGPNTAGSAESPDVQSWLAANSQLSRDWNSRTKLIDDTGLVTVNMGHRLAWPLLAGLMLSEPTLPPFVATVVHKRPSSMLLREMGGTPTYLYRYYKIDLDRLTR